MRRLAVVFACMAVLPLSHAEAVSLADLKSRHASLLSKADLELLLPGKRAMYKPDSNITVRWTNEPGGKFIATGDRGAFNEVSGKGQGSWSVKENGSYCVAIDWPRVKEDWCRFIFQADGRYYGVRTLKNESAQAVVFEFSK